MPIQCCGAGADLLVGQSRELGIFQKQNIKVLYSVIHEFYSIYKGKCDSNNVFIIN